MEKITLQKKNNLILNVDGFIAVSMLDVLRNVLTNEEMGEMIKEGLMKAVLGRDDEGNLIRKAGVMGIVIASGSVKVGDTIEIRLPKEKPYKKLDRV